MADTKAKAIKILSIIGNTLLWVFVAFSVAITALVFASQGSDDGIPSVLGKSLITIVSPSMTPTYEVGDLIFMEKLSDDAKNELKVGDIITYKAPIDIDGDGQIGDINTHRIVEIDSETGAIKTKGDLETNVVDNYTLTKNDIIGICKEDARIGGVGNVLAFLRTSLGFFLCIVLPLILFFIYELYNFIMVLVTERAKKQGVSKETEEEIKKKAIEEYLKAQQAEAEAAPEEDKTEE